MISDHTQISIYGCYTPLYTTFPRRFVILRISLSKLKHEFHEPKLNRLPSLGKLSSIPVSRSACQAMA
jgi:hypothetical protein